MNSHVRSACLAAALALALAAFSTGWRAAPGAQAPAARAQAPKNVRLYIFDCGLINVNRAGTERYKVTPEEVGETRFSVPCFLVAHPRGTLMWDLGIVPDDTVEARAQGREGNATATAASVAVVTRTLKSQLAEIGYRPEDITYFAFSHAHVDHERRRFAASSVCCPAERVHVGTEQRHVNRRTTTTSEFNKSISLDKDECDVFGDGKVVIKAPAVYS